MKHFWGLLLFFILSACHPKVDDHNVFTLHLFQEPPHLDPTSLRSSSASYFFHNMLRGLYRYDSEKGLVEEGGHCHWQSELQLICKIQNQFWQTGESVTADDYVRTFQKLVDPKSASPRSDLLENLINGKAVTQGQLDPKQLGVKASSPQTLQFDFANKDPEFLYKLTSSALLPTHQSGIVTREQYKQFIGNGPYQIKEWKFGKEMNLTPNPHFKKGHPKRPNVRFYFIDDEMTAYRLYLSQKLSFLRRIPSNLITALQNRPDFYQIPMARFDYYGFGERLTKEDNLRKALLHGIDYVKLQKLLHALGRPGCPSIPKVWMDRSPCYSYDLKLAKSYLSKVDPKLLNQSYSLKISQTGGADIKKQAEFIQNQWKEHLGFKVEISQMEDKVFINELKSRPPDIFRKGVGLDVPTCLNALETFSSQGRQNFIHLNLPKYESKLAAMAEEKSPARYRTLCRQAVEMLIDSSVILPMGEMHFSLLASPKFKGWSLNMMNQLDLSQLHQTH